MQIQRLHIIFSVLASMPAWFAPNAVPAAEYPTKPIRLVIPYTPGGPTDLVGRAVAAKLQDALGQQVIVSNRAGGGGVIATEIVARAPADGYTLLLGTPGQLVTLPLLTAKLPYKRRKGFRAGHSSGDFAAGACCQRQAAGHDRSGTHHVRESAPRAAELCVGADRWDRPPRHGIAEAGGGPRNAARALQGHGARAD